MKWFVLRKNYMPQILLQNGELADFTVISTYQVVKFLRIEFFFDSQKGFFLDINLTYSE